MDTTPLLYRESGAMSAVNDMLKLRIKRAILPDDALMLVSEGVVWDVQLSVERKNIMAVPCSPAKVFQIFRKDCWQKRSEYRETWNSGV